MNSSGRAITPRSFPASIFAMTLLAVVIQVGGALAVKQSTGRELGTEALSMPAVAIFVALTLIGGSIFALARTRFLSRAEAVCVLFSCLIASPLMSHGLWRFMLACSATIPRYSDFEKLDAFNSKFWPHGPNLLDGKLSARRADELALIGEATWASVRLPSAEKKESLRLSSTAEEQNPCVRIRLPISGPGSASLVLEHPHMLTILARATDLGPESRYYGRVYVDDSAEIYREVFVSNRSAKVTYLQTEGFNRTGLYGLVFPSWGEESVTIEFGLSGAGTVEWTDPQLVNVEALESAFLGRKIVNRQEYESIRESLRGDLIVKPDRMLSPKGILFLITGYFPLRLWIRPALAWGGFVILLLAATYAVALIMRRQWIQNERYPLPLARIPLALLGASDAEGQVIPAIWRNRLFWIGFATTFFWCAIKGWHFYDSNVPDARVWLPLKAYFTDAGWGRTFDEIEFKVYAIMVGLALLMELNVLFSLFLGFFLFRLQYWFGEANGLTVDQNFPYSGQQMIGAYLVYALLSFLMVRKYLWSGLLGAIRSDGDGEEVSSFRSGLVVLLFSGVGVAVWARWVGLPGPGLFVIFLFWVTVGFVAMRFRAECGTPYSEFFIVGSSVVGIVILPFLGGITLFGPGGIVFAGLASLFLGSACLLFIPGLQLELIEIGRILRLRRFHTGGIAAIGIAGGFLIGGWAYLSTAHAIGADNYPATFEYGAHTERLKMFADEMREATEAMTGSASGDDTFEKMEAPRLSLLFGAGAAAVLTLLRQFFAGFWFHPIGFILGPTDMIRMCWGSLLLAWMIRLLVLKIGGAAAVREKLRPFAIGVFMAAVAAYAVFGLMNAWFYFHDAAALRYTGLF